jgi:hypothetical protein
VPGYEQTNVRLPLCALNALAVVMARRGISRDEAVRQVLGEHVERQENREPEDRLSHISTILRYPAPPRWRGDPRTDRSLRLRLVPGVIARARAVSLRLPGQSPRAHRDYQTRLLTDAMMTAIAVQEPFSDEFLAGLLPLLRHGAALGLWQLAVAVTSTPAEDAIRDKAEEARSQVGGPAAPPSAEEVAARYRVQLVDDALDEEVAWHSPARFQAAANLARDMLNGANASANEQLLYEQKAEWNELRLDLRSHGAKRDRYRAGTTDLNWSGRGGAAVWRAERRVELQDLADWLINYPEAGSAARQVNPPAWLVRVPRPWRARIPAAVATGLAEPYATWVAAGRLLAFPVGSRQAVWPLIPSPDRPGWTPVPGIEPILAAAAGLRSEQVVSFIEAVLVDWSTEGEHPEFRVDLLLPADEAFGWGFIGEDELRDAVTQARVATLREMSDIIDWSPDDERTELEQARGDPQAFGRTAARLGIKFTVAEAVYLWRGRSVVNEMLAGTRAAAVRWLAGWAHSACTMRLQQSMEQAWRGAFDHHPAD